MQTVNGEPSFHISTPEVDFDITARGGHLAPAVFHLPGRDVSPYALAPWEPAEFPEIPPLLSVLRGDFFCLPFAGKVDGPPHGDPANAIWHSDGADERSLRFAMDASDTGAHLVKILTTRAGHHAIYSDVQVSNLEGNFNYGNHPILDLSGLPEGAGRITTSDFFWASVFPGVFSNPANGESQALLEGSQFASLQAVQLTAGGTTDLTRYPQRAGYEDLVMMANSPATVAQPFAWSAVVLDGYLWFTLKNPADFPATMFWMSNGGRSAPPWNKRHLGRIGIEEACSYFCNGLELSQQDLLKEQGIPTTRKFTKTETVSLRTIQAVALCPESFGAVREIYPNDDASVIIRSESGEPLQVAIDWRFVL
jgi:hypothetical protein